MSDNLIGENMAHNYDPPDPAREAAEYAAWDTDPTAGRRGHLAQRRALIMRCCGAPMTRAVGTPQYAFGSETIWLCHECGHYEPADDNEPADQEEASST